MAFGGALTLSTPARAIEISNVAFLGCLSRSCSVPFTQEVQVTASGSPPIVGSFGWGDGNSTQLVGNNGTTNLFDVSHTYATKGNYTLNVTMTDRAGAIWTSFYKVSAWKAGYFGAAAVEARIEGYGLVGALQRKTPAGVLGGGFTAMIRNTGSAYIAPLSVQFYAGADWSHPCGSPVTISSLAVGSMAYASVRQVLSCESLTPVWVRTTSTSVPALNGTSPKMTVSWSNADPPVSVNVIPLIPTLTISTGNFALIPYIITNTGMFSVDFYGFSYQTPDGSLLLIAQDLGNPYHGLVLNGSTQQALLGSAAQFQGTSRIVLQPGQSIQVNRTVQAVSTTASSIILKDNVFPYCVTNAGDVAFCTAATINPTLVTVSLTVVASGATIQMVQALPLGNGTEQFTGMVLTMGQNTPYLSTWFTFWKKSAPTVVFRIDGDLMFAPGTMIRTASGLSPGINYSVAFNVQGTGPSLTSNTVSFVTSGGCTGAGCANNPPGSTAQNFVQAILFQLSSASGIPVEIFGFFMGLMVLSIVLLGFLVVAGKAGVDLPISMWVGLILVVVVLNVLLFMWPAWVIVVIIVPEGLMLWREVSGEGGSASG